MALTDKDILITPNKGAASDPKIDFIGANASTSGTITMTVLTASGTTLAFTGTVGTLFQISNVASTLSSVVSVPSTVNATGTTTGALVVSGGVGIGQDLRVGGLIYGTLAGQVSAASQVVVTNDITSSTVNFITFVNTSSGNAGIRTAATTGMVYVPSTGFMGVGATNPTERLQIGGGNIQLDNTRAIKFKNAAGVSGNVLRFGSDNHTYLESPSSGNIILRTGGTLTDRLQILPSGYVGIGTGANSVTTAFPLHVYGDISGGQIAVENGSGSTTRQAGINYRIDGADLWQTYVNNADSSNSWRIKYNNANDYFTVDTAGNAALGTVTPGDAIISPAPARYFEIYGNGGNPALRLNGNALNQTTIQLVAGVPNVSTSGFTILDETAGANRLSIDSAGRTSINTSTVGNTNFYLDVWGSIGASAGSITIGSGGAILPGSMYSSASYGMLIRAARASPSLAQFLWQTSAGSEIMRIDPNLNLGFGTTAAFEKFVMLGAANTATNPGMSYNMVINASNALTTATLSNVGAGIALGGITTGTTTATFAIISGVKENTTYSDTAGAFIIGTRVSGGNVTEKLRVTSAGSVGVGTITPTNRFQVVGGNYTIGIADSASGNRARLFWQTTSGSVGVGLFNDDNSNLMFGTNNTERVRIDVNGNVFVYNGYLKTTGGVADDSGGNLALQVLSPGGASTATTVSTVTGAIKIRLPQGYTDTMMRMTVKVYTYNNSSFDITLGGYQNAAGSTWLNTFAYMNTTAMPQLNVRFGFDGTYNCIFIGEINSTWSYPQVFVTDFQAGYNSYAYTQWVKNWNITYYAGSAFANTAAGQYITKTEVAYPTWNKGGTNGLVNVSQLTNDAGYLTSGNTVAKYTIGQNAGSSQWIYLGRWATSQNGYTLRMTISAITGYNATASQNQRTEVFFKTSNASSFQTGSSGNYYADGQAYRYGANTSAPSIIRVVQVDQSTYDFYGFFGATMGNAGSMYEVAIGAGSWTNSSTVVTPSGNYVDLTFYTGYTSQSLTNLSQLNNDVPFYKSGDSPTFGTVTANSYAWNGSGNTVGTAMLNMTHDSQTLFNGSTVLGDGVNSDLVAFNLPNSAEYYNGTAWSSTAVATFYDAFRGKVSQRFGGPIALNATTQQRIRFTWTSWGYKFWNGVILAGNAQGNNMWLTVETSADGTTWTNQINDVDIGGGWPNYNYVRDITNNSGSSPYLRITIRRNTTGANSANLVYVNNISIIGSYGGYTNLFDWDYSRNVTFPGNVYAPVYYDSNNSNYYVDPASSSLVNTFTAAGLLKGTYDGGSQGYTNWQIVASPAANGAFIAVNRATAAAGEAGFAWASAGGSPTWINYLPVSSTTLGWYAGAGIGVAMTLTTAGALNVTASTTSPIFYDRDDTTYYADPNSASRFNQLKLTYNSASGLGTNGFNVASTTLGGLHFNNGTGPSGNGVQAAITFMGSAADAAQAGIYVHNNNSQGTHMAFATTDSYATGPQVGQYIYNTGYVYFPRSYVQAAGSFRAPIFYDTDNTAYYTDPAGTSNINALDTAGTIRIQPGTTTAGSDIGLSIWHGSDASGYGRIRFYQNQSNNQTIHAFGTAWQGGTFLGASSGSININGSNGVTFGPWNGISAAIDNSGNLYVKKWFDLDNQAYYVDPNSTTRLNNLQFAGAIQGSVTHYGAYDSSNNLLATPSGVDITGAFVHFTGAASIAPYALYRTAGDWPVPYGIGFSTGGESSGIFQRYASNGSSLGEMVFYTGNDGSGSFAWRRHTWESTSYNGSGSNQLATALMLLDWSQNLYVYGSARAPIFYDQDNTGYYGDFASTSNMNVVNMQQAGVAGSLYFNGAYGNGYNSDPIYLAGRYIGGNITALDLYIGDDGRNYSLTQPSGGQDGSIDYLFIRTTNGDAIKFIFGSDGDQYTARHIYANNGYVYSNIFYDSGNTGYYLDPAGTSNLSGLTVGGYSVINTSYLPWVSNRDFTNGTLVQTNIPMPDYGDPWVIEITGNSYSTDLPWSIQGQGYIYSATNINVSFISNGRPISGLQVIRYGGNLCFWWPRNGYWQGFTVKVYVPYATYPANRVTSITDTGLPSGYDRAITPTIYQSYNTYNQTSYDVTFNRVYANADMRAPIYYDKDDTGYYMNPNGDSRVSNIYHTGWSRFYGNQGIYNQDYGVHFYGENSEGWGITGSGNNVKLQFRSNHLSTTRGYVYGDTSNNFGFLDGNGNWRARIVSNDWIDFAGSSARASIFYDRDDTTYYVNPNGDTYLYGGIWNNGAHGSSTIRNRLLSGNNGAGTGEVRLQMWCSEPGNTWDWAGFGYNVDNTSNSNAPAYYFGRANTNFGQAYMRFGTGGQWYFYTATSGTGGTRYTHMYLAPGNGIETYGILYNDTSVRAYIYYDRDNTGYYLDPASTSYLNKVYMDSNTVWRNYGIGPVGTYSSYRYQNIFSMGESWLLPADGSSTGNLYGLAWSHPNAGGAASNLSSHGMILFENGSWNFAVGGGSARSTSDMRSPIFYDQNDTGYYSDPNGTSNLNRITAATNQRLNIQWRGTPRSDITGDSNYWTNTHGWGTSYGTWNDFWYYGAGFYDCWGYNTGHPQGSGYVHTQGLQSGMHYTSSGSYGYGFQMVGAADQGSRWWLRGLWGGSMYSWYEIMLSGRNVGYTLYANIFYDSDDTGYYVDPNGTSNFRGNLYTANGYSYVAYGYNNSGGFAMNNASTYWGLMSNISANDWRIGYGSTTGYVGWNLRWDAGGTTWSNYSHRAPIFYDSDNTGYYVDPNSDSNVWRISGYQAPRYNTSDWADAFRNTPAYSRAFHGDISSGGPTGTWWFYDSMRHSNGSGYWGTQIAYGWEDNANNIYQRNITNNSFSGWVRYLNSGNYNGYSYFTGAVYGTIYYDYNNTSYYCDPASYSQFSSLEGNNYVRGARFYWTGVGGDSGVGGEYYMMYQENGGWSYPYPDLIIANHTGIKIGAYYGYNGTRFYNNSPHVGSIIGSFGDGDNNLRSYYNIIAYASDKRLKENIVNIPSALSKVLQLNGVTFDWKPMVKDLGFEPDSWHEVGVLAQEVEAVLPEAVEIAPFDYKWDAEDGTQSKSGEKYLTVKYEKIVPLLIEAIKEQQQQIDELKELVRKLTDGNV